MALSNVLLCDHCGELPATCSGTYEENYAPTLACDQCCAHGNEDGNCSDLGQAGDVRGTTE